MTTAATTISLCNSSIMSFLASNAAYGTCQSDEFDLAQCGLEGGATISVRVAGFWSADPITLRVQRRKNFKTGKADWLVELSRSTGGRYTKDDGRTRPGEFRVAVNDDLEAEENFAAAMMAAVRLGRQIRDHASVLEQVHQNELANW